TAPPIRQIASVGATAPQSTNTTPAMQDRGYELPRNPRMRTSPKRRSPKFVYGMLPKRKRCPPLSPLSLGPMVYRYSTGGKPLPCGPSQQRRMMDDSIYPLDAVTPPPPALPPPFLPGQEGNHRLVENSP